MTKATWKMLVTAISSVNAAPEWLRKISQIGHEQISGLPKIDDAREGQIAGPSLRELTVQQDYLEFLKEQIQLNARGRDWTELLNRRLEVLQPLVGKKILEATFYRMPESVILSIDCENKALFLAEIFGRNGFESYIPK